MQAKNENSDPFEILVSIKPVIEDLKHLSINEEKLDNLAQEIKFRYKRGIAESYELGAGSLSSVEDILQLIFIENVVNFCFWPRKTDGWVVEYPKGNLVKGGWYSLAACFERGLEKGIPILDSNYLKNLSIEQAHELFVGNDNVPIPLLKERCKNLNEAGVALLENFDGKIINLIKQSEYDAVKITGNILRYFPSFNDVSILDGGEVRFLKRAQICPNDFSFVLKNTEHKITNLDKLTAYADYKLPQIFRMFGVLEYSVDLATKVDSEIEILHDSREEIEIRSATIWIVELLKQKIGNMTAGEIDNTIWILSQENEIDKPHHLTRTIFY